MFLPFVILIPPTNEAAIPLSNFCVWVRILIFYLHFGQQTVHAACTKWAKPTCVTTNGEFKCSLKIQNLNFRLGSCLNFGFYKLLRLKVETTWSDDKKICFKLFMYRTFKQYITSCLLLCSLELFFPCSFRMAPEGAEPETPRFVMWLQFSPA